MGVLNAQTSIANPADTNLLLWSTYGETSTSKRSSSPPTSTSRNHDGSSTSGGSTATATGGSSPATTSPAGTAGVTGPNTSSVPAGSEAPSTTLSTPAASGAFSSAVATTTFQLTVTSGSSTFTTGTTSTIFTPIPSQQPLGAQGISVQSTCIGNGIDAQATGIISTLVISWLVGFLIWLIFAFLRPRYRQLYGLREWFVGSNLRPEPLSRSFWAFLFPPVPLVPSLPSDTSEYEKGDPANDAKLFPTDEETSQRTLWLAFLVVLGWMFLGLVGALPLYLASTPCVANSLPNAQFGGGYSSLQDLSLLRLLALLDDRSVTTSSLPTSAIDGPRRRTVVDGTDYKHTANVRLIILTVFVIVLALIPALYKILNEFSKLANFRQRWLQVRCEGLEMAWLSASRSPGFAGWGERQIKDFIRKAGLSSSIDSNPTTRTPGGGRRRDTNGERAAEYFTDEEKSHFDVDIRSLFSICDTSQLAQLIDERDIILNQLEIAETRYIMSFRLSTPDPSVADFGLSTVVESQDDNRSLKAKISGPRALTGRRRRQGRHRAHTTGSAHPSNYVAPSLYYKLGTVRGVNGGRMDGDDGQQTLSETFRQRITGTRFHEIRDSLHLSRLPLGSRVRIDQAGQLRGQEGEEMGSSATPLNAYGQTGHAFDPSSSTAREPLFPYHHRSASMDEIAAEWDLADDTTASMTPQREYAHQTEASSSSSPRQRRREIAAQWDTLNRDPESALRPPGPNAPEASQMTELGVLSPPGVRESFPMRQKLSTGNLPPHLRVQTRGPFVRPLTGLEHADLGEIYADISEWRSRLKAINTEIAERQSEAFAAIAEGRGIKGWIMIGRGLRHLPGVEIIEGRAKEDIRWSELQHEGGLLTNVVYWSVVCVTAIVLGGILIAVAGLSLGLVPNVFTRLPFLARLSTANVIPAGLAVTLAPAVAVFVFFAIGIFVNNYASRYMGTVSVTTTLLTSFKTTFFILLVVSAMWLIAVGAVIFAVQAFGIGSGQASTVADGSVYMAAFFLAIMINVAVIAPGLLLLQPIRLWKLQRRERAAITPRERFRARYPHEYNPSFAFGCCVLGIVYASTFSLIFPLITPPIVLLIFLTLVAHRYLIGYVYGRTETGQTGGLLQLWLLRRFGTIIALQPLLLGLILLTRRLWVLGGILVGVAVVTIATVEGYCTHKLRQPGVSSLSNITRDSLDIFKRTVLYPSQGANDENTSLVGSGGQGRARRSIASVLEMMSITLAVMPSSNGIKQAIPLRTEALDDLAATAQAARTHPDAPPNLPPLPFLEPADEMASILYPPELLAPDPIIWLPNDSAGIARSEAYDLQKYHNLKATIDVKTEEDAQLRRSSDSRRR